MKKQTWFIITIFIFAILLRLYWVTNNLTYPLQNIQQDRYADYAYALADGSISTPSFPDFDKRLFPAYPWLIVVFQFFFVDAILAGIAISVLAAVGVMYLMWYLYRQLLPVLIIAFFPPMWVKQSAKVATETLFVFISLLALVFFEKKKPFLSGLFIGVTFMIRPVALALLGAEVVMYGMKREWNKIVSLVGGFIIMTIPLFLFNAVVFGPSEVLQQFTHGDRYGGMRLGFIQIVQDISLKLHEGEVKLVISGLIYVALNFLALVVLYYFRKQSKKILLLFFWQLFTMLFILTFSPFTLLGDFGRYALASVPAFVMSFSLAITALLQKLRITSERKFPRVAESSA